MDPGVLDRVGFQASRRRPTARLLTMPQLQGQAEAIRQVRITPPNSLFDTEATIDLGDRRVKLEHLGKAHTEMDVTVTWCEAR